MDQGTDRISEDLKDIVRTRGAIADKLELIERRLTSSVEEAKAKADEIVGRTQASVQEAVDSVKAATDPQRLAHDHPWLLLSGAIAVGMTLGVALRSTSRQNGVIPYYPPNAHAAEVMPEAEHEETRQEGVYPYYPGTTRNLVLALQAALRRPLFLETLETSPLTSSATYGGAPCHGQRDTSRVGT